MDIVNIRGKRMLWLRKGYLDFLESLDDIFTLLVGKIEEVLLDVLLLILDLLGKPVSQLLSLNIDKSLAVGSLNVFRYRLVPLLKSLKPRPNSF
jgi:hypothetical protein